MSDVSGCDSYVPYYEPEAVALRLQEAGRFLHACASTNVCAQRSLRAPKPDEHARMTEALDWVAFIPIEQMRERRALMHRALGKTWQQIAADLKLSPAPRCARRIATACGSSPRC